MNRSDVLKKLLCRLLCGCVAFSMISAPWRPAVAGPAMPAPDKDIWESRIFVDRCPTEAPAAFAPWLVSILTFLIPKAIDFGISFVNRTLQDKKQEEETKNNARNTSAVGPAKAFYRISDNNGKPAVEFPLKDMCVIFVRGNFAPRPAAPPNDCDGFFAPAHRQQHTCTWLHQKGIYSSGELRGIGIYLESKLVVSDDNSSFRLQPNYFSYFKPLGAEAGDDGKYDLTFTFNFESASAGQAVTPFGLAIVGFQQLNIPGYLDATALEGKSSGWTPVLPLSAAQLEELKQVRDLYAARDVAKKNVDDVTVAIAALDTRTKQALAELTLPPVAIPPANTFPFAAAEVKSRMAGEDFDDTLLNARLDADAATGPTTTNDAIEAAKRRVARQLKMRPIVALRAKVNALNQLADEGLRKTAERAQASAALAAKETEIADWNDRRHEIGPVTVRLGVTEQPYRPVNKLLLTLAEAFAASKGELSTLLSQTVTQSLGLGTREAELTRIRAQADLEIAALQAVAAFQTALRTYNALTSDATDEQKQEKKLAATIAKINADVACAKLEEPTRARVCNYTQPG